MLRLIKALPIILGLCSDAVIAATLIDIQSAPGGGTQVMIDEGKARIGMGGDQGYVLIDNNRHTMFAVVPEQKQIIDMSGDVSTSGGNSSPRIKTELLLQGGGPTIAGYTTEVYALKANGKNCGRLFGSKAAMKITGIASLFDSMRAMVKKQQDAMGSYAAMMDACTLANMDFASQAGKVGVPMRMQDNRGNTVSEIKNINTSATLPADAFDLPRGYKMVSMEDQLSGARQGVSQAQRQMPDMQKMMQQMQHSGQVSPEALEQMKRYQEMMQQYR